MDLKTLHEEDRALRNLKASTRTEQLWGAHTLVLHRSSDSEVDSLLTRQGSRGRKRLSSEPEARI